MGIISKIGSLLSGGGGSLLDSVGKIADKYIRTGEEKDEFLLKTKELMRKHEADLIALDNEDRASARNMQAVALAQNDRFSKRFVYYLAGFWSLAGVTYVFLATFTEIVNDGIADTTLGFLMGTIVSTIINFFFGSSRSSQQKDEKLDQNPEV